MSQTGTQMKEVDMIGTVKTHVKSILEKFDAGSRTAAVITAQRSGLLL